MSKKGFALLFLPSLILTSCSFITPEPENEIPVEEEKKEEEKPQEEPPVEEFKVDKSLSFGMTDISFQEHTWTGCDYKYSHKLFEALGVKSVRFWAHVTEVLTNPTTVNESNYKIYREIFDDIKGKYQIIGMNHTNFHKEYTGVNSNSGSAKPPRDHTENSKYMRWLQDYETSWYTLVTLFPEIEYWEIDNECNNVDFMHRIGSADIEFTIDEMAEIYYDMSFVASRGIHRANPNAKTVMGGLVTWASPTGTIQDWLNHLYDLIEIQETWPSNNPDDFFQVACWHPYRYGIQPDDYKAENDSIYAVIKEREGKDKKVFLTEAGFNENWGNYSEDRVAQDIETMYRVVVEQLPYVESLHYYRMYDEKMANNARFGLFTNFREINTKTNYPMAHPKKAAYTYQALAGGQGDLTIYEKHLLEA